MVAWWEPVRDDYPDGTGNDHRDGLIGFLARLE